MRKFNRPAKLLECLAVIKQMGNEYFVDKTRQGWSLKVMRGKHKCQDDALTHMLHVKCNATHALERPKMTRNKAIDMIMRGGTFEIAGRKAMNSIFVYENTLDGKRFHFYPEKEA